MGGRRWGLVALMCALATTGCGARVQPDFLTQTAEAPALVAATETEVPTPQAQSAPETSEPTVSAGEKLPPLGQGPTDPASPYHNNGNIKISLSSLCVRPNDIMVATITGGPNAGYAMSAIYADGDPHGAYNAGESGDDGVFRWRFPVLPGVPEGRAQIYVMGTGTNWEGKDGGTANAFFQVAGPEGCTT